MSGKSTLSNHAKNKSIKSKKSKRRPNEALQTPTPQQNGSPLAPHLLNQKLTQFSNQIDQDWQQKSQASLDKMQRLQQEYERIRQRREQIMHNLNADGGGPEPSPQRVLLMNEKPKVKNYEPVQRKHSPNIKFDVNAEHLRQRSMREHPQLQNLNKVGARPY